MAVGSTGSSSFIGDVSPPGRDGSLESFFFVERSSPVGNDGSPEDNPAGNGGWDQEVDEKPNKNMSASRFMFMLDLKSTLA